MIKIYSHKIEHQPKKKKKKNHVVYSPTNSILKDKIEKTILKITNEPKNQNSISS